MEPCANCTTPHASAFCPVCGEKRRAPGIRLSEVLHEFIGGLYHAEGPIPSTLLTFFRGPGKLTRAFIAGKRKSFVPPVRYFLFGVAFYFIIRYLLHWDPVDAAVQASTGAPPMETPAMRVNHWMSRNVNLLLPILMVMLATFDRLLFPRTVLTWVERLVHYLFASGTYLLVSSALLLLTPIWPPIQFVNFFIIFGIIIWACIALHRRSAWTVVKAVLMVPITFVLYVMLSTVLVALALGVPLDQVLMRPGP